MTVYLCIFFFFFQAEDGIRDLTVTGVQTCALPISDALTEGPRLLFLGRIEPRSGLGTALAALPRILARYPNAVLTVAGDGPWRGYYERRARSLGASVRFVGQVFEERPEYYASADLYLCPTTIASFGVTLL